MDPSTVKHEPPAKTRKKRTTTDFLARKHGEKITSVTANDYSTARWSTLPLWISFSSETALEWSCLATRTRPG